MHQFLRDLSLRPSDSLFKSFLSQLGENVGLTEQQHIPDPNRH